MPKSHRPCKEKSKGGAISARSSSQLLGVSDMSSHRKRSNRRVLGPALAIIVISSMLHGCSSVVDLVVANNSGRPLEICNLNLDLPRCVSVDSGQVQDLPLVSDYAAAAWRLHVGAPGVQRVHEFTLAGKPEFASDMICSGFLGLRCEVGVQIEQDGRLYWVGARVREPVDNFPEQPAGFPVAPSA